MKNLLILFVLGILLFGCVQPETKKIPDNSCTDLGSIRGGYNLYSCELPTQTGCVVQCFYSQNGGYSCDWQNENCKNKTG